MDNPKSPSEHADLPQGQQENLSLLWSILEQHKLQLDRYLQVFQNEQIQVSLRREISMQNTTIFNVVESMIRGVLMCKHDEIASLHIELERKQVEAETTRELAVAAYEINQSLISMFPPVQQEPHSHVSSNGLDAPGFEDEASSVARTAKEATQPGHICKVCNSGDACMLLLPCRHLCACKPCGVRLTTCTTCGGVKSDAIEVRFV